MRRGRRKDRPVLIALVCAGFMVFNFPLMLVWDQQASRFGLPMLPLMLFAIWAGLIGLLALVSERGARRDAPGGKPHVDENGSRDEGGGPR